jgi:two-component system response regulator HupR/HoxA
VAVDVRLIAATNRNLEADVASGRFREDLYYRVAGITLPLPALRERPQDIAPIIAQLLKTSSPQRRQMSEQAMKCLIEHAWPGNVRELQNEVRRALALGDGPELGAELLSARVRQPVKPGASLNAATDSDTGLLRHQLERVEAQLIGDAMLRHKGNKTHVADELGLTRVGLRMKLMRLGLEKDGTPF